MEAQAVKRRQDTLVTLVFVYGPVTGIAPPGPVPHPPCTGKTPGSPGSTRSAGAARSLPSRNVRPSLEQHMVERVSSLFTALLTGLRRIVSSYGPEWAHVAWTYNPMWLSPEGNPGG